MKIKHIFIVSSLLILTLALSPVVRAAETPQDQLSPEAREAFDEGMVAAGQKQWMVAIRYFEKSQKAAPTAPEVLFNLGLAESKVPGRELRSMAWLQAYALSAPAAGNAEAVRMEIANLKARVEGTLEKLVSQAKQLASQTTGFFGDEFNRRSAFTDVAVAQARTGDIAGAKLTATKGNVANAWSDIAVIQYIAGDTAGAEATIQDIRYNMPGFENERSRRTSAEIYGSNVHISIACFLARSGDFAGAEAEINKMTFVKTRAVAFVMLGYEEALAGKKDQSLAHAAQVHALTQEIGVYSPQNWEGVDVFPTIQLQARLGDVEGAKKIAARYGKEVIERIGFHIIHNAPKLFDGMRFDPSDFRREVDSNRSLYLIRITGDRWLSPLRPLPITTIERVKALLQLFNEDLGKELFIDPQSALQAIAAKPRPVEIINGMTDAIQQIANRLNDIKRLSR